MDGLFLKAVKQFWLLFLLKPDGAAKRRKECFSFSSSFLSLWGVREVMTKSEKRGFERERETYSH
jgi:hypothetical protein